jgi:hypothetical protein
VDFSLLRFEIMDFPEDGISQLRDAAISPIQEKGLGKGGGVIAPTFSEGVDATRFSYQRTSNLPILQD